MPGMGKNKYKGRDGLEMKKQNEGQCGESSGR